MTEATYKEFVLAYDFRDGRTEPRQLKAEEHEQDVESGSPKWPESINSQYASGDVPSPTKPELLSLLKLCSQLGTKHSNAQYCGGHLETTTVLMQWQSSY